MRIGLYPALRWPYRAMSAVLRLTVSILVLGLITTSMVRFAPGFGTDERELDARLSNESIDQLRSVHAGRGVLSSYLQYIREAADGDLGFSHSFNRPVSELIGQRYSTTAAIAGWGLLSGWSVALLVAASGCVFRNRMVPSIGTAAGGLILCTPAALLAYTCFVAGAPAFLIVALVVFARVFRVLDNLFQVEQEKLHVTAARASGVPDVRILFSHILGGNCPALTALAAASVAIAVGAIIPAEALSDQPGLGQLVWKAALARDLELLVSLTLLIGATTMVFNRAADTAGKLRSAAA